MTTYLNAIDTMFGIFNEAWQDGATSIVGSIPEVRWQGTELPTRPDKSAFWAMASIQNVIEQQTTLKSGVAPSENRRYTLQGLLIVQIYCPLAQANSLYKGRQLAVLVRDAFRGQTRDDVWFRNARIVDVPPEDEFYRLNVVVEYEFDDIG